MNYKTEFDDIIQQVTNVLGKPINKNSYQIIDRGIPHQPKSMGKGKMAIYIFIYNDKFLKIGKAGPSSNSRFLSQHYNPSSSKSNLAASLLADCNMRNCGINKDNVGEWIKNKCRRIDILLNSDLGIFSLELIEAILHYKYQPVYEGFISQR